MVTESNVIILGLGRSLHLFNLSLFFNLFIFHFPHIYYIGININVIIVVVIVRITTVMQT